MASVQELKKIFAAHIASERLAHGYLLFGAGARGGEADTFAGALAAYIETGNWDAGELLLDSKTLSGRDIGIDAIRDTILFLWEKPVKASKKTLIIREADALPTHAVHALLKTVEEPPAHTLILLIAKDAHSIIPPLLSRLQRIYVSGDERARTGATDIPALARALLNARSTKERSDLLKGLLDEEEKIPAVVSEIVALLREDEIKNARLIAAFVKRWAAMERFSTNRKLQLEAAFAEGAQMQ